MAEDDTSSSNDDESKNLKRAVDCQPRYMKNGLWPVQVCEE